MFSVLHALESIDMKRLTLILSLAIGTPSTAEVVGAGMDERLGACARFSSMIGAVAEARIGHDDLVTAIRDIPDLPEVQEFRFERSLVQKAMLQIELLHGELTPEEISGAMEISCVEKVSEAE